MKRIIKFCLIIIFIIALDQISKGIIKSNFHLNESLEVIKGFFNITYVQNRGAAFGILADVNESIRKPVLFIIPVFVCFFLIYLIKQIWRKNLILETAYCLILAGAFGNLIDRYSMNYVVDFLDFYWGRYHFPAFNVADSAISIATGLLIFDLIMATQKKRITIDNDQQSSTGK